MSAHAAKPTVFVIVRGPWAETVRAPVVRDAGDYEGLHRAPSLDGVPRLQGHECRPWMFHAMPTIGSACAACGRHWPWIEPPALYFGGP